MRELVACALIVIDDHRLHVAKDLEAAEALAGQLKEFRVKAPLKDALSDWRPAIADDRAVVG